MSPINDGLVESEFKIPSLIPIWKLKNGRRKQRPKSLNIIEKSCSNRRKRPIYSYPILMRKEEKTLCCQKKNSSTVNNVGSDTISDTEKLFEVFTAAGCSSPHSFLDATSDRSCESKNVVGATTDFPEMHSKLLTSLPESSKETVNAVLHSDARRISGDSQEGEKDAFHANEQHSVSVTSNCDDLGILKQTKLDELPTKDYLKTITKEGQSSNELPTEKSEDEQEPTEKFKDEQVDANVPNIYTIVQPEDISVSPNITGAILSRDDESAFSFKADDVTHSRITENSQPASFDFEILARISSEMYESMNPSNLHIKKKPEKCDTVNSEEISKRKFMSYEQNKCIDNSDGDIVMKKIKVDVDNTVDTEAAGVLRREIMVAETVKGYPYSALPSLFPQDNYSCTSASSCSSALMSQGFSSQPRQRMDMPQLPPMNNGIHPVSLGGGNSMQQMSGMMKDALVASRKQREFIPDNKKDEGYWDRRRRNNEAAKRSREKRRLNDMILEQKVMELSKENHMLKAKINAYETKFQIKSDSMVDEENILASMPSAEQILSFTRRTNFGILPFTSSPTHQSNSSLLSPNSLPSSPPSQNCNNSLPDDDQYPLPSFNQHQEVPCMPAQSIYPIPMSPDPCLKEQDDHSSRLYSPENMSGNSHYEETSPPAALNLSARASRSPIHMDYSEDNRSTDYSMGNNISTYLPHKLRIKNRPTQCLSPSDLSSAINNQYVRQASPSISPNYNIKTETGEGSPESSISDDRDSGVSISPSLQAENGFREDDNQEELEYDNEKLRAHVERLSNEVFHLRHVLNRGSSSSESRQQSQSGGMLRR